MPLPTSVDLDDAALAPLRDRDRAPARRAEALLNALLAIGQPARTVEA